LTQEIIAHVQASNIANAEALASSTINGTSFSDFLNGKIATIGENLVARKVVTVTGTVVNAYVHTNGRVGVLLAATCDDSAKDKTAALLKSLAMHASL
jgi:elongation factor Ts